jgi:hypothetical protein
MPAIRHDMIVNKNARIFGGAPAGSDKSIFRNDFHDGDIAKLDNAISVTGWHNAVTKTIGIANHHLRGCGQCPAGPNLATHFPFGTAKLELNIWHIDTAGQLAQPVVNSGKDIPSQIARQANFQPQVAVFADRLRQPSRNGAGSQPTLDQTGIDTGDYFFSAFFRRIASWKRSAQPGFTNCSARTMRIAPSATWRVTAPLQSAEQ